MELEVRNALGFQGARGLDGDEAGAMSLGDDHHLRRPPCNGSARSSGRSAVRRIAVSILGGALLAGCAVQPEPLPLAAPVIAPARDALYAPAEVRAGRLAYAPDRTTFAPVLTERVAYPTQAQAQNAFMRSPWAAVRFASAAEPGHAASVRLFACRPGALDGQTGRMARYRGPVVLCATEFLDAAGQPLWRAPINFYFHRHAWRMHDPDPPRAPAPWLYPERSPPQSWNPFGDRT
jgi:hypothetical protein